MTQSTFYKNIFENNTAIILILDNDSLRILDANPSACEFHKITNERIKSKKVTDIVPENVHGELIDVMNSRQKGFISYNTYASNGQALDIKMFIHPLCIDDKEIVQITILDTIVEDREREISGLSKNKCKLGITGKLEVTEEHYADPDLGWKSIHTDDRFIRKNGEAVWSEQYNSPILYDNGELVAIEGIGRDITERKLIEGELISSEEKYSALMGSLPVGVFVTIEEEIVFTNKVGLELVGAEDESQVLGKDIMDFSSLTLEAYKLMSQRKQKIAVNGEMINFIEIQVQRLDGSYLDVEVGTYPTIYEGKKAAISVARDISDRKMLEKLRKDAEKEERVINELEEHDKLKTQFFSNISHELKTPLNIILGGVQLINSMEEIIAENNQDKRMAKYVDMMKQNCYRLLRLINNLIDITKYDTGFLKLNFRNHNIVGIVEDIALSVAEYIGDRELSITFDTEIEEKMICCDADSIERVILNLLSNSIKFTNDGGNIDINIYDREENIEISIKDDGIGIPDDMLYMIFERFKQVDTSLSRRTEGSGIGLSLVKAMVEAHEGKIKVNSRLNQGSEFIISLPARILEEEQENFLYSEIAATSQSKFERVNIEFSDIYS